MQYHADNGVYWTESGDMIRIKMKEMKISVVSLYKI